MSVDSGAMTGFGLHYWKNVGRAAEVDFLLQHGSSIVPLEAKSSVNVRSKSLPRILEML